MAHYGDGSEKEKKDKGSDIQKLKSGVFQMWSRIACEWGVG